MYNEKPYFTKKDGSKVFLYFDTGKKQWRFSLELGSKKDVFFATTESSTAKCPADLLTQDQWQTATGTFGRFKQNKNVKVVCVRN